MAATIQSLRSGPVSPDRILPFDHLNDLLDPGYLAVKTDFPGATGAMLGWWFCGHADHANRYWVFLA